MRELAVSYTHLFVAGLKMGVAGVAWATFLCQGVSCVLAMVVVFPSQLTLLQREQEVPRQEKWIPPAAPGQPWNTGTERCR